MKTALVLAAFLLPYNPHAQKSFMPYNDSKSATIDKFVHVSDSLKAAGSDWHFATAEELKQLRTEKILKFGLSFQA